MPGRVSVLCSDCSLLFNHEGQVETDAPSSKTTYIPVPHSHRLHVILTSTDPVLALVSSNDCHFCSLLARMRSRRNQVGCENGSTSMSSSHRQDIFLDFYYSTLDLYHTIEIRNRKGYRSRNLLQNARMILFKPTDSRISNMTELDQDSTNTSSNATFSALDKWISMCDEKHHRCRPPARNSIAQAQDWLPSRLVKIDKLSARVVKSTEDLLDTENRYTTLSYCWGPPPITFKRLLQDNIEDLNTGFDINTLPKTFQDAIAATSLLGLNLIWIDALCIVQDSDEDWRIQSVKMSQVYARAYINLAAAASVDVHGGLFRERNPFSLNPFDLKVKLPGYFEGSLCCVPEDPWVASIRDSPLFARAWTFQEKLLSRRTVYFAEDQLYWECGELCASEIYPLGGPFDPGLREPRFDHPSRLPDGVQIAKCGRVKDQYALLKSWDGAHIDSPGFLQVWGTIVETYSKGRLTFPRDRLVAISGVVKQLSDHTTEKDYFLGTWRQHLPILLLWLDLGSTYISEGHHPLITPQLGPSWSWSSHLNPVSYSTLFTFLTEPEICAEVLDVDVNPGITPFTQDGNKSGRLVIKAPMIKAKLSTSMQRNLTGPLSYSFYMPSGGIFGRGQKTWAPFLWKHVLLFTGRGMQTSYPCRIGMDSEPDSATLSAVFCLKVANADVTHPWGAVNTDFGLILSHTGKRGQYRRVGCFEVVPSMLVWSWRSGRLFWWLRSRSLGHLKQRLFQAGDLEPHLYQDFDGVGAYTIEII